MEEDIKSTLEGTTAAATKLAFDKKVRFAVGPAGFYGPAAAAVFNPNKVMYVLEYSTCQPGELGPYGFLGGLSSITTVIAILNAAHKEFPNVKKLAPRHRGRRFGALFNEGGKKGARTGWIHHGRRRRHLF